MNLFSILSGSISCMAQTDPWYLNFQENLIRSFMETFFYEDENGEDQLLPEFSDPNKKYPKDRVPVNVVRYGLDMLRRFSLVSYDKQSVSREPDIDMLIMAVGILKAVEAIYPPKNAGSRPSSLCVIEQIGRPESSEWKPQFWWDVPEDCEAYPIRTAGTKGKGDEELEAKITRLGKAVLDRKKPFELGEWFNDYPQLHFVLHHLGEQLGGAEYINKQAATERLFNIALDELPLGNQGDLINNFRTGLMHLKTYVLDAYRLNNKKLQDDGLRIANYALQLTKKVPTNSLQSSDITRFITQTRPYTLNSRSFEVIRGMMVGAAVGLLIGGVAGTACTLFLGYPLLAGVVGGVSCVLAGAIAGVVIGFCKPKGHGSRFLETNPTQPIMELLQAANDIIPKDSPGSKNNLS